MEHLQVFTPVEGLEKAKFQISDGLVVLVAFVSKVIGDGYVLFLFRPPRLSLCLMFRATVAFAQQVFSTFALQSSLNRPMCSVELNGLVVRSLVVS